MILAFIIVDTQGPVSTKSRRLSGDDISATASLGLEGPIQEPGLELARLSLVPGLWRNNCAAASKTACAPMQNAGWSECPLARANTKARIPRIMLTLLPMWSAKAPAVTFGEYPIADYEA